jgi:hypothetical protein
MGFLGFGKKKDIRSLDALDQIIIYANEAEKAVKRINKEWSDLAAKRQGDPSWNRTFGVGPTPGKEFMTDAEALGFHHRITQAKKEFAQKAMPLVQELLNSK